jgi:hypothetical protein
MYISLGINIVLLIAFVALLIKYLKTRREDREFEDQIQRSLTVNRNTGQVGPFSLGSLDDLLNIDEQRDERRPLLQSMQQRPSAPPENRSNASSVSDDTFLRHRPEYMLMKTFKPESRQPEKEEESKV